MREWLHEHGLSLVIGALWIGLTVVGLLLPEKVMEYAHGLAHDTFGALVIVIATKYFIERGSAESRE